MQVNKSKGIKIFSNSIGFILFIICAWGIYHQILIYPNLANPSDFIKTQWKKISFNEWGVMFFLGFLNYLLEAVKWKLVVPAPKPIKITEAIKNVMVGQAFAFFTPGRLGDYFGRTLFLEKGTKWKGMAQMAWASYAQLLATLIMSFLCFFIEIPFFPWLKWGIPLMMGLSIFIYFTSITFTGKLAILHKVQIDFSIKIKLVVLSLIRYGVFIIQYLWAAKMLAIAIPFNVLVPSITLLFLLLSIAPTISLTELLVRGQLMVVLLSPYYSNTLLLIGFSSLIWAVNLLLPAVIGAFLLISFRLKQ